MRTIGFFGDSYCAYLTGESGDQKFTNLKTYMSLVSENYDVKVVNRGVPGSSIYDSLLLQFGTLLKNKRVPDICVFVWTDPNRLFHRYTRRINLGGTLHKQNTGKEWTAARHYYEELHDPDLSILQYVSTLHYYDDFVFSKLPSRVKIIHMWSFGEIPIISDPNEKLMPDSIKYLYRWKHGVEIRPSLVTLSENLLDPSPNHIGTQEQNNALYNWIRYGIENYKDGRLLDYTKGVLE
jgi:hypothetical protein